MHYMHNEMLGLFVGEMGKIGESLGKIEAISFDQAVQYCQQLLFRGEF